MSEPSTPCDKSAASAAECPTMATKKACGSCPDGCGARDFLSLAGNACRRLVGIKSLRCMAYNYYKMVSIEFDCLIPPPEDKLNHWWKQASALKADLDQKASIQQHGCGSGKNACIELADVLRLEMLVLHLLPDERLLAKAWSIRDTYRQLVPSETYRTYEENNSLSLKYQPRASDADKKTPEQLELETQARIKAIRQDAVDVLAAIHWWYTNSNYREKRIARVKQNLIHLLFICTALVLALSQAISFSPIVLPLMVLLMGMLGAIFSIGRRMLPVSSQNITESDPVIKATQFDHGDTGIFMSVWIGGISALLLYLLMAGITGINLGDVSPKFVDATKLTNCAGLDNFFCALHPEDMKSLVRLLCWSFVAGFAEKFVPDILDRMAKDSNRASRR